MFITPYFWGCKYTNNFLFINNIIEIQHFGLLITCPYAGKTAVYPFQSRTSENMSTGITFITPFGKNSNNELHIGNVGKYLYIWEFAVPIREPGVTLR